MATRNHPITEDLIFHSDRGIQYACEAFTKLLEEDKSITRSMSSCDPTAQRSIFEWIESWYNTRRRHSSLGYFTMNAFENQLNNQKTAA